MAESLILVADGDRRICNLLNITLTTHDYKCITASTGESAIIMASSYNPDIIIMDSAFSDLDGTEVIRKIRSWSEVPIVVISARGEDHDKVMALDSGADDYLTKPFSVEELLARLRVMERRFVHLETAPEENPVFENGYLKIDYTSGCVYVDNSEVHLTPIEYKLLCTLAKNTGRVLTHTQLTKEIWGNSWDNNVMTLRVFMASLRKKIDSSREGEGCIATHTGIGYRMIKF